MKRKYTREEVDQLTTWWGLYANPDDLNIFVRKKGRPYAWTMNYGNKLSRVITGAILLGIALIMALQHAA